MADQVTFTPAGPPTDVAATMRRLDVLVLPSSTTPVWKEQFGRVLVEAMACRVAVIGSDSGAIPEVVGGAGMIFPEGNAAALCEKLSELIRTPALREQLAEAGYQRVLANYTQERIAEKSTEFYRQLVATPSK